VVFKLKWSPFNFVLVFLGIGDSELKNIAARFGYRHAALLSVKKVPMRKYLPFMSTILAFARFSIVFRGLTISLFIILFAYCKKLGFYELNLNF